MSPIEGKTKGTGVGVIARRPITIVPWAAQNVAYTNSFKAGRGFLDQFQLDGNEVYVANYYGHTGGRHKDEAAQSTDHVVGGPVRRVEMQTQPGHLDAR